MLPALVALFVHAADAPKASTGPRQLPSPYSIPVVTTDRKRTNGDRHPFAIMSLPIIRMNAIGPNAEENFRQHLEDMRDAIGPDARVDRILGLPPQLVGRDPNVNDRGTLDASSRGQSVEAAAEPIAFKRVFENPDGSGSMVRGNGALYATFPFSIYKHTKKGILIQPAPGTLYRIGMPLEWMPNERVEQRPGEIGGRVDGALTAELSSQINRRLDRRIDTRIGDVGTARPGIAASSERTTSEPRLPVTTSGSQGDAPLPRIAMDEAYRRAFFATLINSK